MAIERIKLNLIPAGTMPVCHASQYDKKRQMGIDIYNGLQPYILSDELLELDVRKPDGHIVTIDVPYTAGGNGVVFETTEQMCAVAGANLCELKITKGEAEIGSLNFYMEIERSPMENGLASDSEIANLRTQMQAIAEPMLDDLVPPMVESLVPEVVGENYYNKNEINTIVDGIDTALEGIGHDIDGINDDIDNLETELESKANANEVAEALESKANANEVAEALELKADKETTYTKEEVDDIIYNILPDDTASGSVANFETDLALPIKSLEIDVNAKQDLHGYDNPWTAGGGKNLIDNADFFSYSSWETDLVTVGDFPTSISNRGYALPTISGETYTISFGIDASNIPPYVYLCKSDGETSTRVAYITTGSSLFNRTYTFTSDGSLYYLRSGSMSNESSFNTQIGKISYVQLEKGSTATEYAPYENICPIEGWSEITLDVNGNTEVINLGGTYYGGYFTQDKAGHRQFEVTHKAKVKLRDVGYWNYSSSGKRFYVNNVSDVLQKTDWNNHIGLCECYVEGRVGNNQGDDMAFGFYNASIYLRDSNYSDVTTWLNAVGDYYITYQLATPIIIDLPNGEPIITLIGTNNIFADTGDTSVVFKDSVSGYVEKKIASVQALTLNT